MNIGIIGVGNWGKKLLNIFNNISNVKACACLDVEKNINWFKKHYPKIILTDNYKKILDDTLIDAVVIATPIKNHYQIARESIIAQKHIFIEKPVASSAVEVNKLIKLEHSKVFFINHIFLYNPCFVLLKSIIQKVKVNNIKMIWNKFGSFNEDLVYNLFTHEIAILSDLFDFEITNLDIITNKGVVTNCDMLRVHFFINGISCDLSINRYHPKKEKIIMIRSENKTAFKWVDNSIFLFDQKRNKNKLLLKNEKNTLEISGRAFLKYIRSDSVNYHSDLAFGSRVLQYVDNIAREINSNPDLIDDKT